MGIKFLCTQCGKKLNVKAFLAGKRAICPHCSHKIEIPPEAAEHTIMTGVSPLAALKAAGGGAPAMAMPVTGAIPTKPSSPGHGGVPAGAAMRTATPAMPIPVQPATTTAYPAAPASPMPGPGLPSAAPVYAAPTPVAMPVPVPAPQPSAPPDPITEAPTAVWYVRPPTGGQFGPAPGDTMRKWITEGRVTADSLVWREGWADWKGAGGIFPALGATLPPPAISGVSTTTPSKSSPLTTRGSGGGSSMAITLVVVLVVLIVALLAVLAFVLLRPGAQPAKPKDTARASVSSALAPGAGRTISRTASS